MFWFFAAILAGFFILAVAGAVEAANKEKEKEKKDEGEKRTPSVYWTPFPVSAIFGWNLQRFGHFVVHFTGVQFVNTIVVLTSTMLNFENPWTCALLSIALSVIIAGILTGRTAQPSPTISSRRIMEGFTRLVTT